MSHFSHKNPERELFGGNSFHWAKQSWITRWSFLHRGNFFAKQAIFMFQHFGQEWVGDSLGGSAVSRKEEIWMPKKCRNRFKEEKKKEGYQKPKNENELKLTKLKTQLKFLFCLNSQFQAIIGSWINSVEIFSFWDGMPKPRISKFWMSKQWKSICTMQFLLGRQVQQPTTCVVA